MAASILVDAGFLVALLSRRDGHHPWAVAQAERFPPPWHTCEAALSEAFHLLGPAGAPNLAALLRRDAVTIPFALGTQLAAVLTLLDKYATVPASLADVGLLRMTETMDDPQLLTTGADFKIYRRHGRQIVPIVFPD